MRGKDGEQTRQNFDKMCVYVYGGGACAGEVVVGRRNYCLATLAGTNK